VKTTIIFLIWSLISPQELAHGICNFSYLPFLDLCKFFPNVENQEIILGTNCSIIHEGEITLLSHTIIEYTTPQDAMKNFLVPVIRVHSIANCANCFCIMVWNDKVFFNFWISHIKHHHSQLASDDLIKHQHQKNKMWYGMVRPLPITLHNAPSELGVASNLMGNEMPQI
jgi:hypothetical protein